MCAATCRRSASLTAGKQQVAQVDQGEGLSIQHDVGQEGDRVGHAHADRAGQIHQRAVGRGQLCQLEAYVSGTGADDDRLQPPRRPFAPGLPDVLIQRPWPDLAQNVAAVS